MATPWSFIQRHKSNDGSLTFGLKFSQGVVIISMICVIAYIAGSMYMAWHQKKLLSSSFTGHVFDLLKWELGFLASITVAKKVSEERTKRATKPVEKPAVKKTAPRKTAPKNSTSIKDEDGRD
jgi:hypothetical protein